MTFLRSIWSSWLWPLYARPFDLWRLDGALSRHRRTDGTDHSDDRGEVSATTVVLAAALIALAIAVGVIITTRVQDKANTINLG